MNWIFIGMLLGSVVTSSHDSKEACLGRQAVLKDKGVEGQCVERAKPMSWSTIPSGTTLEIRP